LNLEIGFIAEELKVKIFEKTDRIEKSLLAAKSGKQENFDVLKEER